MNNSSSGSPSMTCCMTFSSKHTTASNTSLQQQQQQQQQRQHQLQSGDGWSPKLSMYCFMSATSFCCRPHLSLAGGVACSMCSCVENTFEQCCQLINQHAQHNITGFCRRADGIMMLGEAVPTATDSPRRLLDQVCGQLGD
jgi:hypothetical protein